MPRSTTTIETRSGRCETQVFAPSTEGPWPAVILFMDGLGIRPALLEMAERIAEHGYLVLLPDLFYRAGPRHSIDAKTFFTDAEKRKAWAAKYIAPLTIDKVREDMISFLAYLDARDDVKGSKIGTTGYCMGGCISIAMAGLFPDRVVAAASYHGSRLATDAPDSPHLLAPRIKARVYVAGADEDPSFPDEMKARLETALTDAKVEHEVTTYAGAKHGFVPTDTPVHDAKAAERHWQTLFALFDAKLAPAAPSVD